MKILSSENTSADRTEATAIDVVGEAFRAEDMATHCGKEMLTFFLQVRLRIQANTTAHRIVGCLGARRGSRSTG